MFNPVYFIVKDEYDQATVCIVKADCRIQAMQTAREKYDHVIDGELYTVEVPFIDATAETVTEADLVFSPERSAHGVK
jgi:hypothetical protein